MIVRASRASRDAMMRGTRGREEKQLKREREREGKGAEGKREHGPLCEKNQVPCAYAFSEGGSRSWRNAAPGLYQKEKGARGEKRERGEREREIATIRERLPNGPRLF